MRKVILDTNVIVSALIQKSFPYLILDQLFSKRDTKLCLSIELAKEYEEVLKREKFARFPTFIASARSVLIDIKEYATWYEPVNKVQIIKDKSDNKLLELAEISAANYLITGNTNDFTMSSYKNTKIVTPKVYWELLEK